MLNQQCVYCCSDRDACGKDVWRSTDAVDSLGSAPLEGLHPYTQYAVYAETLMTSNAGLTYMSPIIYFTTRQMRPLAPRIVGVSDVSPSALTIQCAFPSLPHAPLAGCAFSSLWTLD